MIPPDRDAVHAHHARMARTVAATDGRLLHAEAVAVAGVHLVLHGADVYVYEELDAAASLAASLRASGLMPELIPHVPDELWDHHLAQDVLMVAEVHQ